MRRGGRCSSCAMLTASHRDRARPVRSSRRRIGYTVPLKRSSWAAPVPVGRQNSIARPVDSVHIVHNHRVVSTAYVSGRVPSRYERLVARQARAARTSKSNLVARYVIDPVTLLHLLDNDLPLNPGNQLVAPNSIRSEALQLLLDDVRRGARTAKEAVALHTRMTELRMRLLGDRGSRDMAWRITQTHDWDSIRDAEYLAITKLQADAFVTVDAGFAARADGIVPLADLQALLDA